MEKVMQIPCSDYYDAKYLDNWEGVTRYVQEHLEGNDAMNFLGVLRFVNKHDKHYAVYEVGGGKEEN